MQAYDIGDVVARRMRLSSEERVLLFKSPTSEPYAQALLTAIALPSGARFQLTTYRSQWVPSDVFRQPEQLQGKKAILVCVDTVKEPPSITGAYPLRELRIVRSRQLGDQLELIVEMQGFVSCPDYKGYLADLKSAHALLPPNEHSFIAHDNLRNLRVIPPEDAQESLSTWQNHTRALANLSSLEKAVFFWVSGIKDEKERKTIPPTITKPDHADARSCVWVLQENSAYHIELNSSLPRHTEKDHPGYLALQLQYPKYADGLDSVEIRGSLQTQDIDLFTTRAPSQQYPKRMSIEPRDPTYKKAPSVTMHFELAKAPVKTLARRFVRERWATLVSTAILGLAYLYGQLVISSKAYPTFAQFLAFPADVAGAVLTTIALLLLTYVVATTIGAKTEA
jgi:hypothetical protein